MDRSGRKSSDIMKITLGLFLDAALPFAKRTSTTTRRKESRLIPYSYKAAVERTLAESIISHIDLGCTMQQAVPTLPSHRDSVYSTQFPLLL